MVDGGWWTEDEVAVDQRWGGGTGMRYLLIIFGSAVEGCYGRGMGELY